MLIRPTLNKPLQSILEWQRTVMGKHEIPADRATISSGSNAPREESSRYLAHIASAEERRAALDKLRASLGEDGGNRLREMFPQRKGHEDPFFWREDKRLTRCSALMVELGWHNNNMDTVAQANAILYGAYKHPGTHQSFSQCIDEFLGLRECAAAVGGERYTLERMEGDQQILEGLHELRKSTGYCTTDVADWKDSMQRLGDPYVARCLQGHLQGVAAECRSACSRAAVDRILSLQSKSRVDMLKHVFSVAHEVGNADAMRRPDEDAYSFVFEFYAVRDQLSEYWQRAGDPDDHRVDSELFHLGRDREPGESLSESARHFMEFADEQRAQGVPNAAVDGLYRAAWKKAVELQKTSADNPQAAAVELQAFMADGTYHAHPNYIASRDANRRDLRQLYGGDYSAGYAFEKLNAAVESLPLSRRESGWEFAMETLRDRSGASGKTLYSDATEGVAARVKMYHALMQPQDDYDATLRQLRTAEERLTVWDSKAAATRLNRLAHWREKDESIAQSLSRFTDFHDGLLADGIEEHYVDGLFEKAHQNAHRFPSFQVACQEVLAAVHCRGAVPSYQLPHFLELAGNEQDNETLPQAASRIATEYWACDNDFDHREKLREQVHGDWEKGFMGPLDAKEAYQQFLVSMQSSRVLGKNIQEATESALRSLCRDPRGTGEVRTDQGLHINGLRIPVREGGTT